MITRRFAGLGLSLWLAVPALSQTLRVESLPAAPAAEGPSAVPYEPPLSAAPDGAEPLSLDAGSLGRLQPLEAASPLAGVAVPSALPATLGPSANSAPVPYLSAAPERPAALGSVFDGSGKNEGAVPE